MNVAAARTFYHLVVTHLPPSHVVRFMLALFTTVRHAVKDGEREREREGEGEGEMKKTKKQTRGKAKKGGKKVDEEMKNHASKGECFLNLLCVSLANAGTIFIGSGCDDIFVHLLVRSGD